MSQKIKLFDIIGQITSGKEDIFNIYENAHTEYSAWIINKTLSNDKQYILYANEMNKGKHLPVDMQYDFYRYSTPAQKKFIKYPKAEKNTDLNIICDIYECSLAKAEEYISILTEEQMNKLKETYNNKGGLQNGGGNS